MYLSIKHIYIYLSNYPFLLSIFVSIYLSIYLSIGIANSSDGIPCARSAGLSESILNRAIKIKKSITNKQVIQSINKNESKLYNTNNINILKLFLDINNDGNNDNINNIIDLLKTVK
jgi:DNA mismatch repair ATPase MutS